MRELDNNNHSVFALYYHLVFVIKYRRKVINDKLSDRQWVCKSCGSIISRDYNAAKNIRDEGIRILGLVV